MYKIWYILNIPKWQHISPRLARDGEGQYGDGCWAEWTNVAHSSVASLVVLISDAVLTVNYLVSVQGLCVSVCARGGGGRGRWGECHLFLKFKDERSRQPPIASFMYLTVHNVFEYNCLFAFVCHAKRSVELIFLPVVTLSLMERGLYKCAPVLM